MTYIFLYELSIYMGTYDVTNSKTDYINFGGPAYQKEPNLQVSILLSNWRITMIKLPGRAL